MQPPRRILLVEGHPDPSPQRLQHALADAYAQGAQDAGHELRRFQLAALDVPLLRTAHEWHHGALPPDLQPVQDAMRWSDHLVLTFPLWMGDMPALTKAFIEQVARPGFAVGPEGARPFGHKPLSGRSARVVVTMGMPALVYRWFYRAHSLKALERNVLGFIGYGPIHETLIGQVDTLGEAGVSTWLKRLRRLGRQGD